MARTGPYTDAVRGSFLKRWVAASLAGALLVGAGPDVDHLARLRNASLSPRGRIAALEAAWREARVDPGLLAPTRRAMLDVAWDADAPVELRVAALDRLLTDPDPEALERARREARLMLPRERRWPVVRRIGEAAAERGWTDFTPALIRAWSQPDRQVKDADRPERSALERLHPGRPITEVVLEQFLRPQVVDDVPGLDMERRIRADAWDLLARIDADGSARMSLLEGQAVQDPAVASDPLVQDLRAGLADLRAIPFTGEELTWLRMLRADSGPAGREWYAQVASAISRVDPATQRALHLRHAEPIRWASLHRPEWLAASRESLLAELRDRLKGRRIRERTQGYGDPGMRLPERLDYWEPALTWADVLTILILDEAVRRPNVVAAFRTQIELDRKDTGTEYGGVLAAVEDGFEATLYPPRAGQRTNDNSFVASDDMVRAADRALAHYHFHVQNWRHAEYAGPSAGDLVYAARSGRNQLVLTGLRRGVVNVDYYQPNGVIIDLGELEVGAR